MALLAVDSAPCKARPRRGASHVLSDLHIQSLQDTSTYDARQQSAGAGVSLCIPPICYGASSVSVNASKAKVNGDFASVAEQSGIFAGDGGYQIRVQGHTELTGGAVASSPAATDAEANRFDTAAIVTSDLENRDVYEAGGFSLGVSLSGKLGDQDSAAARQEMSKADRKAANDAKTGVGMTPGLSHTSGSQASTTRSGISGGALTITDAAAQHALTGQSAEQAVAALNRDVVTGQDTSGA
ncbi:MAG TPA: hypothetical protein VMN83_01710, partial [Albitalea sp.]|nr:hypothetical protein [Albitalea sp.]